MNEIQVKCWGARDKDAATIWLYRVKPTLSGDTFTAPIRHTIGTIDHELIPQITFENSPVEIELLIKKI